MPQWRVNMKMDQRGPIFDVAASKRAAKRMIVDVNDAIAVHGVKLVRAHLKRVLQNPTGYYESRIAVERREIHRGVWDQRVAYGGWLEGVDSRNRTTRFKGYRTFRIVKQQLDNESRRIAQPIVDRFVTQMNGG
jgi:hypothetical protein